MQYLLFTVADIGSSGSGPSDNSERSHTATRDTIITLSTEPGGVGVQATRQCDNLCSFLPVSLGGEHSPSSCDLQFPVSY